MCTILDNTRTALAESGLPVKYWADVVWTIVCTWNLLPNPRQPKTIPVKLNNYCTMYYCRSMYESCLHKHMCLHCQGWNFREQRCRVIDKSTLRNGVMYYVREEYYLVIV